MEAAKMKTAKERGNIEGGGKEGSQAKAKERYI